MYCNQCGGRVSQEEIVCSVCGAAVDAFADAASQTAAVPVGDAQVELFGAEEIARLVDHDRPHGGLLVVTTGPVAGSRLELVSAETRIGRDPTSDLFLDDVTVSRRHAEIRRIGPAYVVVDLGSFNGTYLNGQRIDEVMLEDLDELQVGRFKLAFFAPRWRAD